MSKASGCISDESRVNCCTDFPSVFPAPLNQSSVYSWGCATCQYMAQRKKTAFSISDFPHMTVVEAAHHIDEFKCIHRRLHREHGIGKLIPEDQVDAAEKDKDTKKDVKK